MALRHHVPEKSGTGLVGAPIAGKTRIAVEMNPAAARPKQFREMTPIPLLRIHEHAHSTALHPSLRRAQRVRTAVPAKELLALETGSVLKLPHRVQEPVAMTVAGSRLFHAYPVSKNDRRAGYIQKLSPIHNQDGRGQNGFE